MFSRFGFFRWVDGYDNPIESLRAALAVSAAELQGSLIVLPEAFNIGKFYRDEGPCNYNREILTDLQQIASSAQLSFVSGLVIERRNGPMPPLSSASVIDGAGEHRLCWKKGDDRSLNYTPCADERHLLDPVEYDGTILAALVCMDCDNPTLERVLGSRLASMEGPKVVCIPACMNKRYGGQAIARAWPDHYVILANSDVNGCKSFISSNGAIVLEDDGQATNRIVSWIPT